MKIYDKPCAVCGGNEFLLKFHKKDFQIVECKACSLVKSIIPENLNIQGIYDERYFSGKTPDGYADYLASEKILKKEFNRALQKILKIVQPSFDIHLLEIGCAYGFFLELAEKYYRCSGIEISIAAAKIANRRCNSVICGTCNKETINKVGHFNILVMLDVIEHLSDPSDLFENIKSQMPRGGIVLLTTGNVESFYSKMVGKYWRLMTPPQHITFFSRKTIRKMFENHGFRILELSTPYKYVPLGLALYQLARVVKYSPPEFLIRRLSRVPVPVNLFDSMQVIAVKQ